jgi:hypothetical protein
LSLRARDYEMTSGYAYWIWHADNVYIGITRRNLT